MNGSELVCQQPIVCDEKFKSLHHRVDRIEDVEEKRLEELMKITNAIVKIEIAYEQTCKDVGQINKRLDKLEDKEATKWSDLATKLVYVLVGVIGSLLGIKLI